MSISATQLFSKIGLRVSVSTFGNLWMMLLSVSFFLLTERLFERATSCCD